VEYTHEQNADNISLEDWFAIVLASRVQCEAMIVQETFPYV
jgi:hypothetical protein